MMLFLSKILSRIANLCRYASEKLYPQEEKSISWLKIQGDKTLRLNYDLNDNSLVFDVGGYEGQWTSDIFSKYCCFIYVFEPVKKFSEKIEKRFNLNKKIKVFNFGLSDSNFSAPISLSEDSSSIYKKSNDHQNAKFLDIYDFISKNRIDTIDLIKINIEGGEYLLLKRMIETKIAEKCHNIQVQFHTFYPRAKELRSEIRKSLQKTHTLIYDYAFVWENWKKK